MDYYLGVDIGTTSAKAVAFSAEGIVLVSCSSGYSMLHPEPNAAEQDPDEICKAVYDSMNKVVAQLSGPPQVVAFSAAMHALVVMDETDRAITQCIIWADNRAAAVAERLKKTAQGRAIYQTTGVPVHAMSPLCKILWLQESRPEIFSRAKKFIGIKDYLFFKLFGEYATDTAMASGTGLLNFKDLVWDKDVLRFAGISEDQLPALKNVRTVFYLKQESNDLQKFFNEVPFVIGGSDGALANLGTGSGEGSITVSIGTSGAARIVVTKPEVDEQMRTFCYHVKDDQYIVGGASNNGAVVLNWLKDGLLQTSESFEVLYQKAQQVSAGSNGLVFIPYILGERAPVWDSSARGIFFGFDINHSQNHLIRACMEGVVYSVFSIAKLLFEKKEITEVYATGGFTHSDLWVQILADVCNRKVLVPATAESSARGAVVLGMEALKKAPFATPQRFTTYEPTAGHHKIYTEAFEKFTLVYQTLKNKLHPENNAVS